MLLLTRLDATTQNTIRSTSVHGYKIFFKSTTWTAPLPPLSPRSDRLPERRSLLQLARTLGVATSGLRLRVWRDGGPSWR